MKSLERLVLRQLLQHVEPQMDALQFAYKRQRGVEDASSLLIHYISEHLEKPGNYARILYIDFSSAFNTMRPSTLISKLLDMNVNPALCKWVLDYLRQRPQRVRVNNTLSALKHTCIGAPQGCVLSPVLFTIYTDNHRSADPSVRIVKYADDTALLGLLPAGSGEDVYFNAITSFKRQCDSDDLRLNVSKTKEMIVDFRKSGANVTHAPVVIDDQAVQTVDQYKYLGLTIQSNLKWTTHIALQTKRASQRLYHLRKLREFQLNPRYMQLFFSSTIESITLFGCVVWGGSASEEDAKKISRIQKTAAKTIGLPLTSWKIKCRNRTADKARKIMRDENHPLHEKFALLPSRRRLRQLPIRTTRFRRTFVPHSITMLNSKS
jgi:hypothetical protein